MILMPLLNFITISAFLPLNIDRRKWYDFSHALYEILASRQCYPVALFCYPLWINSGKGCSTPDTEPVLSDVRGYISPEWEPRGFMFLTAGGKGLKEDSMSRS